MGTFTKVAKAKDVPAEGALAVSIGDQRIALFHVGGQYYAIGNTCTHRGGPLCEGEVSGTTVTCPWHGAEFDISTGTNLAPPAPSPVPCYKVRVSGEDIEVEA
jgi:3-phenylpropionate/trans-cinnamate dioxygenase ferredoxin component